jgi:hypothetical protein
MDDDIRQRLTRAAGDLAEVDGADAEKAVRRATRVGAQRRARATMATFTLVAISAAGVVRLSSTGAPTDGLINPAASGSVRVSPLEPRETPLPERSSTPKPSPRPTATTRPEPSEHPTPIERPVPTKCAPPSKGEHPPRGVFVGVQVAKSSVIVGEPVTISITVRNDSNAPVAYMRSAKEFALWVVSDRGDLWVHGDNLVYTQEMRDEVLAPGESRTRTAVWDQSTCSGRSATPGAYSVMGSWSAMQRDSTSASWMAEPTSLEITKA